MTDKSAPIMTLEPDPSQDEAALANAPITNDRYSIAGDRRERFTKATFILPAVIVVLCFSIFPLLVSFYLSLSRFQFVKGGFEINFIGLTNYAKLFTGTDKTHFLGFTQPVPPLGWAILGIGAALLAYGLYRYTHSSHFAIGGFIGRVVIALVLLLGMWLFVQTIQAPGRPGTLLVTLIYVIVGVTFQYGLGLGLALLASQHLPGRRFFRVVFLLPMMITPVGVAYMFRMLTDTSKGPFKPIWQLLGLGNTSWVSDPTSARVAVIIGDIWQWTPFLFIVLLAAVEGLAVEPLEAAIVDGANRWQIFQHITLPAILPVSITLVLIRTIEAFKIVDLPYVLTNGGPGTATESMTLHAYLAWRTLDLGGSAAVAYMLLFLVTFLGTSYVALVRQRTSEAAT